MTTPWRERRSRRPTPRGDGEQVPPEKVTRQLQRASRLHLLRGLAAVLPEEVLNAYCTRQGTPRRRHCRTACGDKMRSKPGVPLQETGWINSGTPKNGILGSCENCEDVVQTPMWREVRLEGRRPGEEEVSVQGSESSALLHINTGLKCERHRDAVRIRREQRETLCHPQSHGGSDTPCPSLPLELVSLKHPGSGVSQGPWKASFLLV